MTPVVGQESVMGTVVSVGAHHVVCGNHDADGSYYEITVPLDEWRAIEAFAG